MDVVVTARIPSNKPGDIVRGIDPDDEYWISQILAGNATQLTSEAPVEQIEALIDEAEERIQSERKGFWNRFDEEE